MSSLEKIISAFKEKISHLQNKSQLEEIRIEFLGKKGLITELFINLKNLSVEEKKDFGAKLNLAKEEIIQEITNQKEKFEIAELNERLIGEKIDITIPTRKSEIGLIHPISKVIKEVQDIFNNLGFEIAEGPEIEDDFHNFTALNMPKNHPARQMQDTFYLKNTSENNHLANDILLRTHTSPIQIRKMLNSKPPVKIITLGRVFRRDYDQTHTPMFHQIEGLVVDKNINMGHLKWCLEQFLAKFFATTNIALRFRPSFFPFTEPSAEVDIGYLASEGRIKIGGSQKFMEILGCGMVHRNVLKNCQIDPEKYQGFAFGMGIERLAMLKYGIGDLRMFFENDVRFLNHYGFKINEF
jgi:phenylalanyl-tRNA synthetase alpha chain